MMTRHNSFNRFFSLIISVVMLLFATPTPSIEGSLAESSRAGSWVIQGMEFLSHKSTARKQTSTNDHVRLPAYLVVLSALLASQLLAIRRLRSAVPPAVHPLIARRMARSSFLTSIAFQSQYV
ncbi:hypothetical protein [Paenibacillus koleovorans]|uniref:hypothetical protein n=1 Tax=Paenibacillus koleovorans TaxID=121608 RepID=UPI000FD8FEB5|nr:hypothetical protein [Paenibacillus koleovorans]